MKQIFIGALAASFIYTTPVLAQTDCDPAVLEIAKLNLDQKARAYNFEQSDIAADTLKLARKTKDGAMVFTVSGFIYRATYSLTIGVDSSCGVETVGIKEPGL